jgi:hypothetical protein
VGSSLEALLQTKFRIIIFYDRYGNIEYTLKFLYDKGFREGDFVFFTVDPTSGSLEMQVLQPEREAVNELGGMIAVYQPILVGEVG